MKSICLLETMLVKNRNIRLEHYHWQRLSSGLKLLGYKYDLNTQMLFEKILSLAEENKCADLCRVRLVVHLSGGKLQCEIDCSLIDEEHVRLNREGLNLTIAIDLFKEKSTLSNLKSCNRELYAKAYEIATEKGKDDALILNASGNIIETTIANIFWIEDNTVYTPPVDEGCVSGVMRRFLVEKLMGKNIAFAEKVFTIESLVNAEALFYTNAVKGVKWVRAVDEHTYILHPLIRVCSEIVAAE